MKSSLKLAIATAFLDQNFVLGTGAQGGVLLPLDVLLGIQDTDNAQLCGYRKTIATEGTVSLDVGNLQGAKGETISMGNIVLAIFVARRTAATISGSFAYTNEPFGMATGTRSMAAGAFSDQIPVGGALASHIHFDSVMVANGASSDVIVALTDAIGFEVDLLIIGQID